MNPHQEAVVRVSLVSSLSSSSSSSDKGTRLGSQETGCRLYTGQGGIVSCVVHILIRLSKQFRSNLEAITRAVARNPVAKSCREATREFVQRP
jgi:hypothetical protein